MDNHDELATTDDVGNYSSIENYGIIGAMRTCALINKKNASLDFMCYPDFDSPSLFCRYKNNYYYMKRLIVFLDY